MATSKKEYLQFNGVGDVTKFVTKVELQADLKEYEGEKKAKFVASKLDGAALDVYLRLSADDRKNPETIINNLKKEFSREQRDREEALELLTARTRKAEESMETFAYKIVELVRLAYAGFTSAVQGTIAKDYFVKGMNKDMQVALKSLADFPTKNLIDLATEASRLEIAGVGSKKQTRDQVQVINPTERADEKETQIEEIVARVVEWLHLSDVAGKPDECEPIYQQRGAASSGNTRGRQNNRGRGGYRRSREGSAPQRVCRTCKGSGHLFRNCPVRFCQACGNRGHDGWSESCPNFQR